MKYTVLCGSTYAIRREICRACGLDTLRYKLKTIQQISPIVRSVNKFRFTRVGGVTLWIYERRCVNSHKSGRVSARVKRICCRNGTSWVLAGNISCHRYGSFCCSIEHNHTFLRGCVRESKGCSFFNANIFENVIKEIEETVLRYRCI